MKEITINGRTLKYKTSIIDIGYEDFGVCTYFYEGEEEYIDKKWNWKKFKFISENKIRPKIIFRINEDAEKSHLTKDWWREKIEKELELLDRPNQLKKGELI